MSYATVYNICIIISVLFEIFMVMDFYKAFHKVRPFFEKKQNQCIVYAVAVAINITINMQYNQTLNFFSMLVLYLTIMFVMFRGSFFSRLFHWFMELFLTASAELIYSLMLTIPISGPTNEILDNSFLMVASIITVKLIQFVFLSVAKQFSKMSVAKYSKELFGSYVFIQLATFGIMFAIPYVRYVDDYFSIADILLLVFYIIMLFGNIRLFYMFRNYSQMKEQQMMQEIAKTKYEEKFRHLVEMEEVEKKNKVLVHDIKHYLKQIGIYAQKNEVKNIMQALDDLQVQFSENEAERICANHFLNSLLLDFKKNTEKRNIVSDIFVEVGFKIEYIKEVDLAAMLGNLLDNAMEATAKCEDGRINIRMFMQNSGGFSVMRIENNYSGMILHDGDAIVTSKEDSANHGIGIKSAEDIVQRYGGFLNCDYADGIYITTIVVPVGM